MVFFFYAFTFKCTLRTMSTSIEHNNQNKTCFCTTSRGGVNCAHSRIAIVHDLRHVGCPTRHEKVSSKVTLQKKQAPRTQWIQIKSVHLFEGKIMYSGMIFFFLFQHAWARVQMQLLMVIGGCHDNIVLYWMF